MKITRVLKVTNDEFFDNIERGLWKDVKESGGRHRKMDITKPGFTYAKNAKNGAARNDITLLEYEKGSVYSIISKTKADSIQVTYRTKEVKDGLEVEMEQLIDSYEKTKDKKSKISRKWNDLVYFSRMSQTLLDMQTDIEYHRDKIVRPDDSLIPKHYRQMVNNINKEVLSKSQKREMMLEKKKKIEAKKAQEKANKK